MLVPTATATRSGSNFLCPLVHCENRRRVRLVAPIRRIHRESPVSGGLRLARRKASRAALEGLNAKGTASIDHRLAGSDERARSRVVKFSTRKTGNVYPAGAAVPFSAVASYTLDGSGNLSGSAVSSSGGTVSSVTLQGTGTVNSDCTSTLTVGVYSHGTFVRTVTFAIVYVNHGSEGLGLVTSLVLANGTSVPAVLTIDAKKVNTND
jgi:hypothetical protein